MYSSGNSSYNRLEFDPNTAGKFLVCYSDDDNSDYSTVKVGSISGNSISFGSAHVYGTAYSPSYNDISFDHNAPGRFVSVWRNNTISEAMLGQIGSSIFENNLTSSNFIGISTAAYADGETATVTLPAGLSTNQSGLVANSEYYVQTDGTLSTIAGNPSVLVGKALSTTSILLKSY